MKGLGPVFSPHTLDYPLGAYRSNDLTQLSTEDTNGLQELLGHNKITILALATKITIPLIYPECFSHGPTLSCQCTLVQCLKRSNIFISAWFHGNKWRMHH